eukprot:Awhi_evm1s9277
MLITGEDLDDAETVTEGSLDYEELKEMHIKFKHVEKEKFIAVLNCMKLSFESADMKKLFDGCEICQKAKERSHKYKAPMHIRERKNKAFSSLSMDVMVLRRTKKNNRFVIVLVDDFSRFTWICILQKMKSEYSLSKACVQSGLEWDDEIDDVNYFRNRIPNVLGYTPVFMLFKQEANYGHLLKKELPAASGSVGFNFEGADIMVNKKELDVLHNDFRDKQQSISDNNKKRYDKK